MEWAGNYHDYYEINASPALPLISSRLVLKGDIGTTHQGGYITLPSNCAGAGPATTNTVTVNGTHGEEASGTYVTPIGTEGCNGLAPFMEVPFAPTFSVEPETTQSDQPDGVTTELTLPHDPSPTGIDSSQLKNATVTLPEGMTLNPSAAHGLEACTPKQIGIGTRNEVECPVGSKLGTVTLDVPDLPPGSLKGDIYLGGPESGPITGPPYTMYLDAESARYGISVRLKGTVVPNETTGRLTVTFANNPEQPFSDVKLHFKGGPLAPLANPLACVVATTETSLTPYTGTAAQSPFSSFLVDSNGSGGACSSPLPFALTQSTSSLPTTAGASTSYALTLTRPPGQQYLSQVRTVLPPGLVGRIPAVTLCSEAQVAEAQVKEEGCPASSRMGTVTVSAGAGPAPYQLSGSVYLTGPYNGAPYGMAIVVPAVTGPFSLGNVVTRATIAVEPNSPYRVVVTSAIPTIYKGVPLRMQKVSIEVNRQNFLLNPTNCSPLATESTLTGLTLLGSSATATQNVSTPFSVGECGALPFKPSLTAFTGAKTSRANGASLEVKITQAAGQGNMKKIVTSLPKQLPARQATFKLACVAATFEANPAACPSGSRVGSATATTPALPGTLAGTVYFVSHGGEAFPDIDTVLQGDGITTILVGHTNVANNVITTTFESLPDVPVSSFTMKLPTGSELGARRQRQPLHREPRDAHDDRRAERADRHAEDEDLGHQLPGADPQTPDLRHDCDHDRAAARRRAHQRQRHRPEDRRTPPRQRRQGDTQRVAERHRQGNPAQVPPAADQGARRLRAEEEGRHLQGLRHGDLQGLAPGGEPETHPSRVGLHRLESAARAHAGGVSPQVSPRADAGHGGPARSRVVATHRHVDDPQATPGGTLPPGV